MKIWTSPILSPLWHGERVQPGPDGQAAARQAMRLRMDELRMSALDVAEAAGVSYNAINEFLTGRRGWPQRRTRERVERTLSWQPGTLDRIAEGAAPNRGMTDVRSLDRNQTSSDEMAGLMVDWPPGAFAGLTPTERAEAEAAALAAGLARLREIRQARAAKGGATGGDEGVPDS